MAPCVWVPGPHSRAVGRVWLGKVSIAQDQDNLANVEWPAERGGAEDGHTMLSGEISVRLGCLGGGYAQAWSFSAAHAEAICSRGRGFNWVQAAKCTQSDMLALTTIRHDPCELHENSSAEWLMCGWAHGRAWKRWGSSFAPWWAQGGAQSGRGGAARPFATCRPRYGKKARMRRSWRC